MERKNASDFPPDVLKLFDAYVHGAITRRDFLTRAAKFAVSGFSAAAMLESLTPNFAWAQQISQDDSRIKASYIDYPAPKGSIRMRGYMVAPAAAEDKLPGIIVIHENRGLNPYIEDVARRLAVENYVVFAPDALAPLGGYPGDEDKARSMFALLDPAKRMENLLAGAQFLKNRPEVSGRIGAIGFCFGGGVANQLAVRLPELTASVAFYGEQPTADETARIKATLLLHYAGLDERINAGWPAFEKALKANRINYQMFMYPNVNHGFHNDTTPRYDEAAAKLAWTRTLDFFKARLGP